MGQKVSPNALRYGINKDWQSRWYASNDQDIAKYIKEDYQIRTVLFKQLKNAGVSKIEIERTKAQITLFIHCVRVGSVLGQAAANLEVLSKLIKKTIKNKDISIKINVVEIKNPDLDAQILANSIAQQIENRMSHRSTQKLAIRRARKAGAKGIKTKVSGRLGGAEMARVEGYSEGSIPLATLRSNIDWAKAEADTISGKIGVKVWIYKGEILPGEKVKNTNFVPRNRRNSNYSKPVNNRREAK